MSQPPHAANDDLPAPSQPMKLTAGATNASARGAILLQTPNAAATQPALQPANQTDQATPTTEATTAWEVTTAVPRALPPTPTREAPPTSVQHPTQSETRTAGASSSDTLDPPPPPPRAELTPTTLSSASPTAVVSSHQERSPYSLEDLAPPPPNGPWPSPRSARANAPQYQQPAPPSDRPLLPPEPIGPEELVPPRTSQETEYYNYQECPSPRIIDVLHGRPLSAIRLDTTPVFGPGHDESGATADEMRGFLDNAPPREWRNQLGQVVAQGRMIDYRWGKVFVQSDQGRTVELNFHELGDDERCFATGWWGVPPTLALKDKPYQYRHWAPSTFSWNASAACFNPLYFEEAQVERYGHTVGLAQPLVSGAHFFVNIATLPYKMGIHPPNECNYPLGYYRVGNCAPRLLPPIPISLRGGLFQAGAVVGGVAALP